MPNDDPSSLDPTSATPPEPAPLTDRPGRVGRYRVLEPLGEGGFGVVYLAEQVKPVRRRVALKVIKPGMDSRAVVARFEAERQALAMMDHPCVARVLDGGTVDEGEVGAGRPYFVMELVRGLPITDHCDRERLSIDERIGLFIKVCEAVQHAHTKGVIHRDLKPSNVLVEYDAATGKANPKVIDFGVAKAVSQPLTEATLFTERGQMIGTPEYMSPEQAENSPQGVDTRSDVYSLGVMLYELLTGFRPFDFKGAALYEIQRLIREVEPEKPSTKVSSLDAMPEDSSESGTKSIDAVAKSRRADSRGLTRALRRDLDWIAMKCLEKDRERRYETANEVGEDLERYLTGEPVSAVAPSWRYRAARFASRNRVAIVVGSLIALSISVSLATWIGMYREGAKRRIIASALAAEQELARQRLGGPEISPEELSLRHRLNTEVYRYPTGEVPLKSVLAQLAATFHAVAVIDREGLKDIGIEPDVIVYPISAAMPIVSPTGHEFLQSVLEGLSQYGLPATYTVDGNTIVVSSAKNLHRERLLVAYNVAELLASHDSTEQSREQQLDAITDVICINIDPHGWRRHGGEASSITADPTEQILLITTNKDNHLVVRDLLVGLRNTIQNPIRLSELPAPDEPVLFSPVSEWQFHQFVSWDLLQECWIRTVDAKWDKAPLGQILEDISIQTGIPIKVMARRDRSDGVSQVVDTKITLDAEGRSVALLLPALSARVDPLRRFSYVWGFRPRKDHIEFGHFGSSGIVLAYSVSDILQRSEMIGDPIAASQSRIGALVHVVNQRWRKFKYVGRRRDLTGLHDTLIAMGDYWEHASLQICLQQLRREMGLIPVSPPPDAED